MTNSLLLEIHLTRNTSGFSAAVPFISTEQKHTVRATLLQTVDDADSSKQDRVPAPTNDRKLGQAQ